MDKPRYYWTLVIGMMVVLTISAAIAQSPISVPNASGDVPSKTDASQGIPNAASAFVSYQSKDQRPDNKVQMELADRVAEALQNWFQIGQLITNRSYLVAIKSAEENLSIIKTAWDRRDVRVTYTSVAIAHLYTGRAYDSWGDLEMAQQHYTESNRFFCLQFANWVAQLVTAGSPLPVRYSNLVKALWVDDLHDLAICEIALGQEKDGEKHFHAASEIAKTVPAYLGDSLSAMIDVSLANYAIRQRRDEDARRHLEAGRGSLDKIPAEKIGVPEELTRQKCVLAESFLLRRTGRDAQAFAILKKITDDPAKRSKLHPEILVRYLMEEALDKSLRSQPEIAEAIFKEACAAARRPEYSNTLLATLIESDRALVRGCVPGQRAGAAVQLGKCLETEYERVFSGFMFQDRRQRLSFLGKLWSPFGAYLTLAPGSGVTDDEIYRHVLLKKGLEFLYSSQEIRNTQSQAEEASDGVKGQHRIGNIENRESMQTISGATLNSRVTVSDILSRLGNEEVFVDYVFYTHISLEPINGWQVNASRRLLAFVVRQGKGVVCVPLPEGRRPIAEIVSNWRAQLDEPSLIGSGAPSLTPLAQELAAIVWDPLRPYVTNAKRVIISPDGPLWLFPFATLPGDSHEYLIQERTISCALSGRHFCLSGSTRHKFVAGSGLLIVGGVEFEHEQGLPELPGSPAAAAYIAELYRRTHAGESPSVLTKRQATPNELMSHMQRSYRAAIIITIGGRETRRQSLDLVEPSESRWESGLTAQLNLAQAGKPAIHTRDNWGTSLGPDEFGYRDTSSLELVMILACESNEGPGQMGEAPLAFPRALHAGGTGCVVAVLWQPNGAVLQELAKRVCEIVWIDGFSAADAIRKTQCESIADGGPNAHPKNWASLICSGDTKPTNGYISPPSFPPYPGLMLILLSSVTGVLVWRARILSRSSR